MMKINLGERISTARNVKNFVVYVLLTGPFLSFQNCSKVTYSSSTQASTSPAGLTSSGVPNPIPSPDPANSTEVILQTIKPVFAVRGANCLVCHGSLGSNLITDFGYGSANFITTQNFWNNRTAFTDGTAGNEGGTFESLTVKNGTLFVPNISITDQVANTMFGLNTAPSSFVDIFNLANPNNWGSMTKGIAPVNGQPAVKAYSSIKITYPSAGEILALLPAEKQSLPVAFAPINMLHGIATQPTVSGFNIDTSGKFVRNGSGIVQCYGDVVVKGPLFLNNLQLQTDAGGCRLYVTQTVFIQGPVTYVGAASAASNLQITSASAIIMGISAQQLGAAALNTGPSGKVPASPSTVRTNDSVLTTPGGPWPRMAPRDDLSYNPGRAPINGVAPTMFFDNIVADALLVGPELQDAGDSNAVSAASSIPGESVVIETNGDNPDGPRVAIQYSGLLLNAPHVHSRYCGTFAGAIIADVAFLARNPPSQSTSAPLEQFTYDLRFDGVTTMFPALTTKILDVQP